MDSYSESQHQAVIRKRLGARDNGFVRFDAGNHETIIEAFERQAALHAHKSAIVEGGRSWTYDEIDQRSWDIAEAVRRRVPGGRSPVAVLVPQQASFAAAILGILRAGSFYVPLDPSFPEARNARILQQSQARCVLTERAQQSLVERLAPRDVSVIYVEEIASSAGRIPGEGHADDVACIIFTSGSTGKPKGVVQTHRNVLRVVQRYTNSLLLGFEDRVSLLSSCSVTASVGTVIGSLLNGATLCAFSVLEHGLASLADWIDSERITIYRSVPSLFRHLMDSVAQDRIFPSVRIVRLGGDSLYRSDWELFTRHFNALAVLANFYGCSELSTVACCYMDRESRVPDGVLPVGYPLEDVEIAVVGVDGLANWVKEGMSDTEPVAAAGEILLRSRYLSPGYWQDRTATDAVFTPADWNTHGQRSYLTGDLGTLRHSQGLMHVGRLDSQVKLSGFRVEIAEVEVALRGCPGVVDAAVVLHSPGQGQRELIGFATLRAGEHQSGAQLRSHLQGKLPAHMLPSEVILLDQIPTTPNGKIDRAALGLLRARAWQAKTRSAPRTATETKLAEIWREVLNLEQVGAEDNFFELGGNSLLAMKLTARIAAQWSVALRALAVLQSPTVGELAQQIDMAERSGAPVHDRTVFEEGTI